MKIEINVTPDDLADIIMDLKFSNCHSKKFLKTVFDNISDGIRVNMEELEELKIISEEEKLENG